MKGQMKIKASPLKVQSKAAFNGALTNKKTEPKVIEAKPRGKSVPMAPKLNAEAGGKRVLVNEASGAKHKATFRAPRSSGGGSVTDMGYTKVG